MKNTIMATAIALLMVGCGESAPKCDDSAVKDLVLDGSRIELKKQITSSEQYKMMEGLTAILGKREKAKIDAEYKKVFDEIDNAKLELISIRTESTDDKTQRSTCKAQLKFSNEKTADISYIAQMTSEEKLFVEVTSLEE